jgi:hypothetical protein
MDLKPVAKIRFSNIPDMPGFSVMVTFPNAGVDRPETIGIHLPNNKQSLGRRLVKAINDGVAYEVTGIVKDDAGKTYVGGHLVVIGRRLNADLKRLGY